MFHPDITTVAVVALSILAIVLYARYNKGGRQADEQAADNLLHQAHQSRQKGEFDHQEYLLTKAKELYESGVEGDFTKRSSCYVHLADCLTKQGKFAEARKAMEQLLEYWRTVLKQDNADRLMDIDYFIATADFASGTQEIVEFYTAVIERKKQVFGPIHDEVANSMVLHSRLFAKIGEKAKAEELEAQANQMREQLKTMQPPRQQ
jgi:tetratricopeptide (TPR) repeat protein